MRIINLNCYKSEYNIITFNIYYRFKIIQLLFCFLVLIHSSFQQNTINVECSFEDSETCTHTQITINKKNTRLVVVDNTERKKMMIKHLSFEEETIKHLPNNIGKIFQNLISLKVKRANLAEINKDNFIGLSSLKTLILWGNQIDKLPSDTFILLENLEELDLGFNNIETIEQGLFVNQVNLKKLTMNVNKIISIYPDVFDGLKQLTELNLDSNICVSKMFTTIGNQLEKALQNCEPIKKIDERDSETVSNVKCFFEESIHNDYSCIIESLKMEKENSVDKVTIDHIDGKNIKDIKLLKISNAKTSEIRTVLLDQFANLETLIITDGDWKGIRQLAGSRYLVKLFINNNKKFEDLEMNMFEGMSRLRIISLRHNYINKIDELAFSSLSKLRHLDLSHNKIESFEKDLFCESIHLTKLSLANNNIKNVMMNIFETHKKLQILNFHNNFELKLTKDDEEQLKEHYSFLDNTGNRCLGVYFDRKSNLHSKGYNSYEVLMKCYITSDL